MANKTDPIAAARNRVGIAGATKPSGGDPVAAARKQIGIYTPADADEAVEIMQNLSAQRSGIADWLNSDRPYSWEDRSRYQDQITGARNQLARMRELYGEEALSDLPAWYDQANKAIAEKYAYRAMQQSTLQQPTLEERTMPHAPGWEPQVPLLEQIWNSLPFTNPDAAPESRTEEAAEAYRQAAAGGTGNAPDTHRAPERRAAPGGDYAGWITDPVTEANFGNQTQSAPAGTPDVRFGLGNIDLTDRNTGLYDENGNLMTVRSISFEEDGKEILVPTIVKDNGAWRQLTDQEAIDWYHRTGEYLGKFDTVEEANAYADLLHEQQAEMYAGDGSGSEEAEVPHGFLPSWPAPQLPEPETRTVVTGIPGMEEEFSNAQQSLMAINADGSVNAWQTALNIVNDAKNYVEKRREVNEESGNSGAIERPDGYWDEHSSLAEQFSGVKERVTEAWDSADEDTGDEELDSWFENAEEETAAALMIADTYGLPTEMLEGSVTQGNADDYRMNFEGLSYGQKALHTLWTTPASYLLSMVNTGLNMADVVSGGRLSAWDGETVSVFQIANFLQNAGSGLTDQAFGVMLQNTNWLGRLGLQVEKSLMEMGLDRLLGGGLPLLTMGIRSYGASAQEAENRGENWWQQFKTGGSGMGVELLTELMSGIGGSWRGVGYIDGFLSKVNRWIAENTGSEALGTLMQAFFGEDIEEVVGDVINPVMDRILGIGEVTGRGEDRSFWQKAGDLLTDIWGDGQILEDGLVGGLSGMLGGAGQASAEIATARSLGIDVATVKAAERIVSNTQAKTTFEDLTGVQLEADEEVAATQVAIYLTNTVETQNRSLAGENTEVTDAGTGTPYTVYDAERQLTDPQGEHRSTAEPSTDAESYARQVMAEEEAKEEDAAQETVMPELREEYSGGEVTETQAQEAVSEENADNIESVSREYAAPEKVKEIFNMAPETDVREFSAGFRAAYDMGLSGVGTRYLNDGNVPALTAEQRKAAYRMGRAEGQRIATQRVQRTVSAQRYGNLSRVKGTVKGEGVSIADLKRTFNDRQNTAYRLLNRYAETTGVNIVLYNSQANSNGQFPAAQGRFQWKDDTIYIDINSGLSGTGDVNELGKYTMLRTFAHEFTHFIEKWNAAEYNEFRQFVFETLEARGENVHDLIESMQARDESGNMSYEQASREVVADAMMDILPDSKLVQQLAQEHRSIFNKLLERMRDFAGRLKQYYREIRSEAPREAQALKENNAYLDSIVKMWDQIAQGAVENYQGAKGETAQETGTEQVTSKKEKPSVSKASGRAEASSEASESNKNTEAETREAGMDFFKPVEETGEEAPKLARMAAQRNQPVPRERFPANDFTSQAETAPDLKGMVPRAETAPSEAQKTQAAEGEPETPAAAETPAQAESVPQDTPEGAKLRARLDAGNGPVIVNGYKYAVTGWNNTTIDLSNNTTGTGTTYTATVRRVKTDGAVPIYDANTLFDSNFQFKEDAVEALVRVAENNHLLEEAPTRKGSADAFMKGDIFNAKQVKKAAETPAAKQIIEKMPKEAADESTEHTEAEAPDLRGETGDRRDGAGTVRVPAEREAGTVQPDAAGGQPDTAPAGERLGPGRNGNRADAKRNGRSRSQGTGESGVQPGRSGSRDSGRGTDAVSRQEAAAPMTEEEQERQHEALHETTTQEAAQKSTEAAGGNNYQIGESLDLPNGSKARFRANADAIRLVKKLEAEGRNATAEEQAVLARYVGWGGIPEAFDERKGEWSKEYAELKELLTDEEYKAAKGSTLNAHYTSIPVIRAMYRGLEKLGFKGGRMLEPSSGVGNFVGAMPASMTGNVRSWTMVELDNITGLIAKHLYPQNDVRIEGFEKTILPDNYMDVAIGNVPFGNYPVVDRAYPKKLTSAIHNYFFAKSLDKVRPGGIVMFITSSYTMNANDRTVRSYISRQADLLGAIRLPNTAFAGNAGTSVVTDILVLKKRAPGTDYAGVPFVETQYDYKFGYQNEYFKAHPDMVLGEEVTTRGMHYRDEYSVNPYTDRGSLEEQIDKAFQQITGQMDYPARLSPEKTNYRVQRAEKGIKQGGYVQREGKLYQNDGGELKEVQTDEKTAKRITGMLGIRDVARELMNAQQQGVDEKSIKALRRSLNKAYDDFVKENGYLNSPANRKAFADDPDRFSLFALENWDAEKKTAAKADIFSTDTIKPNQTITHADTVKDALAICRNTIGNIDVQVIAQLTGRTQEDVTRELIDSELAFKTTDGHLEPAESYLSGNVRAKLRDAQGLVAIDKDYQHNVDALKAVVPADIPHEQIFVQPGTPWIPESVYSDFAAFILGGNNHRYYGGPDIAVHRSNQTGTFTIDLNNKRLKTNYQNMQEWGTPKRSFLNLLEAMMNSRSVTVTYKDSEGHTIVDRVATDAANEKIEQITKKFQEWLWQDEERTRDLEYLYNETFNNLVTPKYDGSTLTVNGLRAGWSLRPHQADAVQRIVSSGGNTLLAHRVGAGKTLEMAAAAMKLKELGIVQKPMFAVPKSLVAQWGKEFSSYFPAAKLLVAEQSDFTPANRKTFANRIATGNYDAIIVSYEQFEKIPISDSFTLQLYQEQVDEIIQAINEAKEEAGEKSMSVKDMEKKRKQLEAKIQKLSDKAKDTDSIEFEQLGIDSIFIDEAHNFKNLFYTTSMNNVSGLGNKDGSKRAFDLYTKVRYLQQLNGGRGVVFATATPVMNSMSEMYIMQKYLQSDLLDQLGLSTFDAWAKQFGEVVNGVEIKPSGQGYRVKQSFSRFKNMNELQLLFRNFSDVLTKVPGLKIPKMKGGAVKVVECEAGQFQKDYMKELEKRADNIKNVDPREDNMLKITSDGRKISYTQRMIDPSLPYEEGSKLYKCAENIVEEYKASKDVKGTQIVFCDMATPKGRSNTANAAVEEDADMDTESAKLYDDLKKRLVKLGIPAKEIAFIHDADTDAKKSKLFDDMNAGRVRVLIGSTGKMGVGMNAQKRAVAIHHLDAPWRPGDVEQRDGRVFRQGNINEEVSKYVYVTTGSFDARLWDIIDRKSSFIDQIMNGENVGREVEDTGEVTLSAAEVKALASGSPLILEQVQLETDIKKLQNLYMAHRQSVVEAGKKLQEAKQAKAEAENRAAKARKDIKHRTEASTDEKFSITVGNKAYTDKKEAGKVLMAHASAKATEESYTKIGSFAGFDVLVMQTKEGIIGLLKADGAYRFNTYPDNTTLMITNMQKALNGLENTVELNEEYAQQMDQEIKAQEAMMQAPFPKQAELDQKRQRYNEVMEELNPKEEQAIEEGEDAEEESTRRQSISDRDVLRMAAEEIKVDSLSPGEQDALRIFNERLNRLQDAQDQRAELGRQYKEQQFTKGGSRAEADRIRAAMSVLDSKIKSLENGLLSLENKDVLKTVLQKARGVVEQEERRRGDESLKRYRERRNESTAVRKYRDRVRGEVETLRKWLLSPSNKDIRKHVPAEIQKTVADFIDSINLMSKTALRTSGLDTTKADEAYLKNMRKMHDAIKQNVDISGAYSGYADLPADFLETFEALIRKTEAHMQESRGEFVVNQMSAAELRELSHTLKTLRKYIVTMNEFHNNAVFRHAYEAGEESIGYLSGFHKSRKSGAVHKFLSFDYMRPSYAFERFGKGGQSIEREFREGQATQARLAKKIIDFAKKTYTAKEVKSWGEETRRFELSDGKTVTLPITHIMSLYCLSKRPQALTHIYGDGIRVANFQNGREVQLDEGHIVTLEDVQKMIASLTPRQRQVADALQRYMSTEASSWGNYVSMARFDVEQFTEENYFPINSDGRYLPATADEMPDNAGLYALLNTGFTKELKENANNRIVLYNIFDVFANHTAGMTQYRSFALPVLDALKWFNYRNDSTSVRDQLSLAFGAPVDERAGSGSKGYAEQFVINLLRAYNGTAAQGDPYDSIGMKGLHRFNRAQIAFNARVVIQQPMAITRAALMLSPAKLMKGLGMSAAQMQKLAEEMEQHSGIASWKGLGFYDTNISRGLTELIKQNPSFGDQITEIGTKGAETADRFTWAAMWYAAKDSVRRSKYATEEDYMQAVTELFEDVIYKTQVVDSVLTKSEFLRAKGFFPRMLGSFMSEPMTTMSMLTDAYYKYTDDLQRGMSAQQAWKRNGGRIAKTAAVYGIGQVLLAAAQAVMDAWRDDDDYATFMQKYLSALKDNVVEELLPFGKIPLVSELWDGMKWLGDKAGLWNKLGLNLYGNDLSNGWAQYVVYLKKSAEITIDLIQGNKTNYTPYGAIWNLMRGVSGLSGMPIASAWREVQDMWNNTVGHFAPGKKLKTYQLSDQSSIKYAMLDGKLTEDQARAMLVEKGIVQNDSEAYWKVKAWETGDAKYTDVKKAVITGDGSAYMAAMDELTEHGVKEKEAYSEIKSFLRKVYFGKELSEAESEIAGGRSLDDAEARRLLSAYTGMSESDARSLVAQWREDKAFIALHGDAYEEYGITLTQAKFYYSTAKSHVSLPDYAQQVEQYGLDKVKAYYSGDWTGTGLSMARYVSYKANADSDGNGSLKQDEAGNWLLAEIKAGRISRQQAALIWKTTNTGWKKSFEEWEKSR